MKVSCYVETAAPDSRVYFTVELDDERFDGLNAVQRDDLIDLNVRRAAARDHHLAYGWEVAS